MDDILTLANPNCFVCGSEGVLLQCNVTDPDGAIPGEWAFRKCSNKDCELVWLDPSPLESELWKAYTTYHTHTRSSTNKIEKGLLSLANRLIRVALFPLWLGNGLMREMEYMRFMTLKSHPCGKLLDIGCGGGRFMSRMGRKGWEVEGIDFDEKSTSKITRRYGMKTYTGDLLSCKLPDSSYDAITLSHTIEHLFDPEKVLLECMRILKPGGKLVVVTPNVDSIAASLFGKLWRGWEPPRHLHLFSVNTLKRFLLRSGFDIKEIRTSSAGSAVIYRVSKSLQLKEGGTASFVFQLWLLFWSYQKELAEFKAQKKGLHVGQNLFACAIKPLQNTL
jgi:2-polyprenyl-3-methyl-5-hydroxy-6-metoxy-1,4-benzoquinol methylase